MKKDIIKWITGCACFLAFVSCSQTEENVQLHNENEIRFSARIAPPATRVTEQAFEPGDNISVFAFTNDQGFSVNAYADNVKYSYSDGAFRPATEEGIAYPADGGLAFWGIYPYCEQAASTFNFEVAEDQSTATAYGSSDLMTASTSLTTEQNPALSFYHRLACVKFKCSFEEAEEKVSSITVNNVQKNVSIDLSSNTYEGTGETTSGLLPYRNDDESYKILLPPQTIATGTSFMVVRTTAGKEYTWKVPRDLLLASGCRYTYNLKVSAGGEIVFSSSINPWNQEEKDVKKRVKQATFEDFDGDIIEGGITYNYKYNEQGYPIDISGAYYGDAIGTDFNRVSYSDHKITIENKYYHYFIKDGPSKSDSGIDNIVFTLDDEGKAIKISTFDNGILDRESTFSYTNGYITEAIHNDYGWPKQHKQYFKWEDDKMTKMWMSETENYSINYSSANTHKIAINNLTIPIFSGYFCDIELVPVYLPNISFGIDMKYLPTQIVDDADPNWTLDYTWEVDADDYVTKIVETSGDETGKYGTTYTFTYENIE